MQDIGWDLIFRHSRVHDLGQFFHGKLLVFIDVHEAFLKEDLFIEESLLTGHLLEAWRDFFIPINHQDHQEVIFREVRIRVSFERVIIMEASAEGVAQLAFILIVHSDADGHFWILFPDTAPGPNFGYHASILDLSMAGIWAEACWAQLWIIGRICQDKSLI